MTEEWKVFIKGVPGRGEEVIKALKAVGGKLKQNSRLSGALSSYVYIINHNGIIGAVPVGCELSKIIMDNYRELNLPEQWKYGDVLIRKDGSSFDIFYRYVQDFSFSPLLEVTEKVCNEYKRIVEVYAGFYRLATPSEVERFHELLHKHGKDWDAEKKQLVDWKWKPSVGDGYWIINANGSVVHLYWNNSSLDKKIFAFGNCFRTEEEVKAMAEKIKKLLKGD